MAYLFAVASYALRTVGLAALPVWTLDSVLRGRFRQAAWRAAFAIVPILAWQGYVASVERSDAYLRPAYEYQRAPYMFYRQLSNNIVLRDPFTPEKGEVMIVRRIVRNAIDVPVNLGETLTIPRGYFEMALHGLFGNGPMARTLIVGVLFTSLSALGLVLVGGGVLLELLRRRWVVPLYIVIYVGAICLAPFPGQYLRYLMPIAALLALSSLLFLRSFGVRPLLVLGPALALQLVVVAQVYAREYEPISYVDAQGQRLSYRLFFYNESGRGFDDAVDYLRAHADPSHIVAAGTPHWVYLRTGLQSVMPPFEQNAEREQHLLETVPVEYLVVGHDVVGSERYTGPMVKQFADRWTPVYSTPVGGWVVYRRAGSSATWLDASRSERHAHEPSGVPFRNNDELFVDERLLTRKATGRRPHQTETRIAGERRRIGFVLARRGRTISSGPRRLQHLVAKCADERIVQEQTRDVSHHCAGRMVPVVERPDATVHAHQGGLREPVVGAKDRPPNASPVHANVRTRRDRPFVGRPVDRTRVVVGIPLFQRIVRVALHIRQRHVREHVEHLRDDGAEAAGIEVAKKAVERQLIGARVIEQFVDVHAQVPASGRKDIRQVALHRVLVGGIRRVGRQHGHARIAAQPRNRVVRGAVVEEDVMGDAEGLIVLHERADIEGAVPDDGNDQQRLRSVVDASRPVDVTDHSRQAPAADTELEGATPHRLGLSRRAGNQLTNSAAPSVHHCAGL